MNIRLSRNKLLQLLLVVSVFGVSSVSAQQTAEQYIPIGQSPGVSGTYSYIGKIVAVDPDRHTISVEDRRGIQSIKVTDETRIWIDRSKNKRENSVGGYEDCEVGRSVEVMHLRDDEQTADWIKIEAR